MHRKPKLIFSLQTKLFCTFSLLAMLIVGALSYTFFLHMRANHLDELKRNLTLLTLLEAAHLDNFKISNAQDDFNKRELIQQQVSNLAEQSADFSRVYLLLPAKENTFEYLVDSSFTELEVGRQYERAMDLGALEESDAIITSPQDNSVIAIAYAPVKDSEGRIVAVLGIEANGEAVLEGLRHLVMQVLRVAVLTIVVTLLGSWLLAGSFVRRLRHLNIAIGQIAAGKSELSLEMTGKDEVAILAARLAELSISLQSEREEMMLAAIEGLVAALEAKDVYTHGHSSQVSMLSHAIAKELELSDKEQFVIRIAGLLHDIGKIGIPDQILNKETRLDDEERRVIEQHPLIGAKILAEIPALAKITQIVKHHHERWDGSGYPERKTTEEIPLAARIIAVADTYQAMTSDRPYRKGLSIKVAMAELKRCSGSQFDPQIVDAFEKIHRTQNVLVIDVKK